MGLVGNANYYEMADFVLGFIGIDISGDDGRVVGKWPWQSDEDAKKAAMEFLPLRKQFTAPLAASEAAAPAR